MQIKNPVMFVVEVVAMLTTVIFLRELFTGGGSLGFTFQIIFWLWLTVLFANFAEAVAEGRGKAQAATLRKARTETQAKRLASVHTTDYEIVAAPSLQPGDIVLVEAGEFIASDGRWSKASPRWTSRRSPASPPRHRESGGDRSAVTGGTRVLSDWIKVRITAAQGSTFLDRMIALVEGAERQKTPNEIALNILLAGLTIIFVIAVATIRASRPMPRRDIRGDPGGAVRRADPHHDRRAAVGDRHCRHGPAGAFQRAGDVRPRG